MNQEEYWRNQVVLIEAEYDQIIQGLRDELQQQQRRCSELVHQQMMIKATAAADVQNFCTAYLASVKARTGGALVPTRSGTGRSIATPGTAAAAAAEEAIPMSVLRQFLHEYSHGLLPAPVPKRKRERRDPSVSPVHHRLYQRAMARQQQLRRDDDEMEFWAMDQLPHGSGDAPPEGSPVMILPSAALLPPLTSSAPAPVHVDPTPLSINAPKIPAEVSAFRSELPPSVSGRSSAGGSTFLAASAFGLPPLTPK